MTYIFADQVFSRNSNRGGSVVSLEQLEFLFDDVKRWLLLEVLLAHLEWAYWCEGLGATCQWALVVITHEDIWERHLAFVGWCHGWGHAWAEVSVNEHQAGVEAGLGGDWFAVVGLDHVRVEVDSALKNVTEAERFFVILEVGKHLWICF